MPKGWYQLLFVSFVIFLGAIINANIFGNIAVVYQSLNRKASNFEEKIEFADETMKNLKITENLQDQVKLYLNYTRTSSDHQQELDKFLSMLSPSLRQQVSKHIFYDAINQNPIFSDHKEIVNYMLNDLVIKLYLPEDEIIRQFEIADDFYFVSKGECDVYVTDANKIECYTNTIKCGGYFGEVALLRNCKRTASVFSKNYSTLAKLSKTSFANLWLRYPFVVESMEQRIHEEYNDKWRKFMKRSLRNIDYLTLGISDKTLEEIMFNLELISINEDNYLFKAGNVCKDIYIVTQGELEIYIYNNRKDTFFDVLYSGCCIGAYGVMIGDNYAISGKAKSDCTFLKLQYSKLLKIREKFEDLDKVMTEYETYLAENGLPYWDYKVHRNKNLQMKPTEKFRYGIRRIIRIIKSYKSTSLTDLLEQVRQKIKEEK